MPCRDYTAEEEREMDRQAISKLRKEVDLLTRFLCTVFGAIEKTIKVKGSAEVVLQSVTTDPELRKWWVDHKKKDEIRHSSARSRLPQVMSILNDLSPEDLEKAKADIDKIKG